MNDPYWNRSISEIPRDIMGKDAKQINSKKIPNWKSLNGFVILLAIIELFLERKSFSGQVSDSLNYEDFEEGTKDSKWQPILTNQGLILPH